MNEDEIEVIIEDVEIIIEDSLIIEAEVFIESNNDLDIFTEIESSEIEAEIISNPERVETINMVGNLDGGNASSIYGGIDPIDGGSA